MPTTVRPLTRPLAATAAVAAGFLLTIGPAAAHVGAGEGDYHAGSYVVVPFSVPHGCDGSPTTKIRIQMPESVPTVTPTVNPGWDVAVVKEALTEPVDLGEGRTLTERITEVDYTAKTPLADGLRDVFELSMQLPEDAAGTTLRFPTIQECVEGSTEWTMIPAEGQDAHELESPAPSIDVIGPEEEEHGHEAVSTTVKSAGTASSDADDDAGGDGDGSSKGLAIAGLATGVVGMLLGGRALAATKGTGGGG